MNQTLQCDATGIPDPSVMITGARSSVLSVNAATLSIDHVEQSDAGIYTCIASNVHGSVIKTCPFSVGGGLHSCLGLL